MKNPSKIKIPIAITPPKNNSDEMYNLHTHNAGAYRAQAINCRTAHAFLAAAGFADMTRSEVAKAEAYRSQPK
jgi:hypothetical protein